MPYSGINDPDLPDHVQKLPADKREQWIAVFESVLEDTGDEGEAMAAANAAVKTFVGQTAVKALDSEGQIGGYLVVWGDSTRRDLQGEYFTRQTDLGLDWYPRRPVLYHHGLDGTVKADMIGQINTLTPDDTGVWVEAQLSMRSKWARAVWRLAKAGALGWSSGSLAHIAQVSPDGEIKRWPIVEGSLTPSPAEPRHTDAVPVKHYCETATLTSAYKSAGLDVPDFLTPETAREGGAAKEGAGEGQDGIAITDSRSESPVLEDTMTITNVAPGLTAEAARTLYEQWKREEEEQKRLKDLEAKAAQAATLEAELTALKAQQADTGAGEQPARRLPGTVADTTTITAVKDLKFDHLSAAEMAFGWTLMTAMARMQGMAIRPSGPYAKAMYQKAAQVDGVKLPIKSDELNHSDLTNFGDEWVPDVWSSELWRRARLNNPILPLFRTVEMPSNPFELPIEGTDPTVYYVPETADEDDLTLAAATNPMPDSQIGSGKVTLSSKKLAVRVGFSSELVEDSIIAILPLYTDQALRVMADAADHVLLNGDTEGGSTGNINSDNGTPSTGSKYLAFNGLRKLGLVTNTANGADAGGAPTLAAMRAVRFLMAAKYSINPNQLAWITDGSTYAKLLSLNEVVTMDKYGPNATALTGQLGTIDGIPLLVSAEMPLTMADGKCNTSGNTQGQAVCVYRPGWVVGYRRRVNATATFIPYYDAYQLVATMRLAFINFDTDVASVLYNITV